MTDAGAGEEACGGCTGCADADDCDVGAGEELLAGVADAGEENLAGVTVAIGEGEIWSVGEGVVRVGVRGFVMVFYRRSHRSKYTFVWQESGQGRGWLRRTRRVVIASVK